MKPGILIQIVNFPIGPDMAAGLSVDILPIQLESFVWIENVIQIPVETWVMYLDSGKSMVNEKMEHFYKVLYKDKIVWISQQWF